MMSLLCMIKLELIFKFKTFKIKNAIKVKKNLKRNVCGIHVYKIILKGMYMKCCNPQLTLKYIQIEYT